MHRFRFVSLVGISSLLLALGSVAHADTQLTGAGSTFVFPFFSRAFFEYSKNNPGITVNYSSIGSGGGISQFTAKTVDFGASDVPMNTTELAAARAANGEVVQVPVTLGAAAVAYNLPGVPNHIKLTRELLTAIFLGKVTNWSDTAFSKLNPGVNFPNMPILVVHRADGSGTTFIFTDYLSHVSPEWKSQVGTGKVVNWPAPSAIGAKGNEGVAGQVRNSAGAIGYVELAYALQNDISYAALQNVAGEFVLPSIPTARAAAAQKPNVTPLDFSIVDEGGKNSYGITGYTWAFLWKNPSDRVRGKQLTDVMKWVVTSGQALAEAVKYVPLPEAVQREALKAISTIQS